MALRVGTGGGAEAARPGPVPPREIGSEQGLVEPTGQEALVSLREDFLEPPQAAGNSNSLRGGLQCVPEEARTTREFLSF